MAKPIPTPYIRRPAITVGRPGANATIREARPATHGISKQAMAERKQAGTGKTRIIRSKAGWRADWQASTARTVIHTAGAAAPTIQCRGA